MAWCPALLKEMSSFRGNFVHFSYVAAAGVEEVSSFFYVLSNRRGFNCVNNAHSLITISWKFKVSQS